MADRYEDARRRVEQLYSDVQRLVDRDPKQEVLSDVLSLLDAVIDVARRALPGDAVLQQVQSLYTRRTTSDGDLRAADVLLMVGSVRGAIPPAPPVLPVSGTVPPEENWLKRPF